MCKWRRMEQLWSNTHPSLGSHTGSVESALWARAAAGKLTGWSGRILTPAEPGGNAWCPARSLPPTVWRRRVCHRASCSLLRLCVLLSPHRSVLQEGREVGGREAAAGRTRPLLSALSNHSAGPPGAAAARCLRTDYVAFRCSRKYYQQLQGSFVVISKIF